MIDNQFSIKIDKDGVVKVITRTIRKNYKSNSFVTDKYVRSFDSKFADHYDGGVIGYAMAIVKDLGNYTIASPSTVLVDYISKLIYDYKSKK